MKAMFSLSPICSLVHRWHHWIWRCRWIHRQCRFIGFKTGRFYEPQVSRNHISGFDDHQITRYQIAPRHTAALPVPDNLCIGRGQ